MNEAQVCNVGGVQGAASCVKIQMSINLIGRPFELQNMSSTGQAKARAQGVSSRHLSFIQIRDSTSWGYNTRVRNTVSRLFRADEYANHPRVSSNAVATGGGNTILCRKMRARNVQIPSIFHGPAHESQFLGIFCCKYHSILYTSKWHGYPVQFRTYYFTYQCPLIHMYYLIRHYLRYIAGPKKRNINPATR